MKGRQCPDYRVSHFFADFKMNIFLLPSFSKIIFGWTDCELVVCGLVGKLLVVCGSMVGAFNETAFSALLTP